MNTTAWIAVLIVIAILHVAGATIAIMVSIVNSNYKKFVLKNSEAIANLDNLNRSYVFIEFDNNIRLYYKFDNKRNWYNTSPMDYFSRDVRNNIEYWSKVKANINANVEMLEKYKRDVEKAYTPLTQEICDNGGYKYQKCLNKEKALFNRKIIVPKTTISINVKLRYVSPKGQVDESKTATFGYVELNRILDSVSTKRVSKDIYDRLARAERGILSDSMRYDVLKRDNFRCVLCGMSSKDGAILHVDHIIPVSKGGKTVMSNLRTLCEKCNVGKSNKIE